MHEVHLSEWGAMRPDTGSETRGVFLGGAAARGLAEELTDSGKLKVYELKDGLYLTSTSYVGKIVLGDVRVSIRPKIEGKSLLRLLRYAYALEDIDLFPDTEYGVGSMDFHDLLLHQLSIEASVLMSRGLHKKFRLVEADLRAPQGALDIQKIAGRGGVSRQSLPCKYYPRSDDNTMNRALLAGLAKGSTMAGSDRLRGRLKRLSSILRETISPVKLDWDTMRSVDREMSRLTRAYQPSMRIIKMLLESQGTDLEKNGMQLPGFLFDMNQFFQDLVSRFLHEYLRGYQVYDEPPLKGLMAYDEDYNPLRRRPPHLYPDFIIRDNANKVAAILDTKYRDLWKLPLPREMLYQLTIYAQSRNLGENSTILYPTTHTVKRGNNEQRINLYDPLHGGVRAQVILRPVDINRLDKLLGTQGIGCERKRTEFAHYLAFGCP
jgi:5-methylcytosine-specific restriction enzyme subunit McrC